MNRSKKVLFMVLGMLATQWAIAQGPGGQGGQRRDPAEMIKKEKTLITDNITTLSDDQKVMVDKVFVDYEASIKKARAENSGDIGGMREIMQSVRSDKDEALKGIFNEEQNTQYVELMDKVRQEQRKARGNRPGGEN